MPQGLDPVADTFKRHVESEGMKLVKEATEAMEARKDKDAGARRICVFLYGFYRAGLIQQALGVCPWPALGSSLGMHQLSACHLVQGPELWLARCRQRACYAASRCAHYVMLS